MLETRTRPSSAPARQARRYWLIGAIVLVACLVLAEVFYQVANSSTGVHARNVATWDAAVNPILAQSGALASTLHELRHLRGLEDRIALESALDALRSETTRNLAAYRALSLAGPDKRASHDVADALALRASGANGFVEAINGVIAQTPAAPAIALASAVRAGEELLQADDVLRALHRRVRSIGAQTIWLSSPAAWRPAALQLFLAHVRATSAYAPHHALKLVALSVVPAPLRITGLSTTTLAPTTTTTFPTAQGSGTSGPNGASSIVVNVPTTTTFHVTSTTLQIPPPSAVAVLGPTSKVSPVVVLRNTGNVTESAIVITVTLAAANGQSFGSRPLSTVAHIGALAPNRARYLTLAPIALVPKISFYRLHIVISDANITPVGATVTISVGS
jgi:hypothetical protein